MKEGIQNPLPVNSSTHPSSTAAFGTKSHGASSFATESGKYGSEQRFVQNKLNGSGTVETSLFGFPVKKGKYFEAMYEMVATSARQRKVTDAV